MKKAVIYARYSCNAQKETSIEDQIRDCAKYAKEHDLQIIHEYKDAAVSGKTDKRLEFQQMMADSSDGLFEIVLVWAFSRFSRDQYESAIYKHQLKKNHVKVLSVTENIPDGPMGELLEKVLEAIDQYSADEIKVKTGRGRIGVALKGKHVGGRPLLGYKVNLDKTYSINEYNAETVRIAFDWYASGKSYSQIIDELNRQGRKTGAGKSFGKNSLHELLTNERYIGTYTYNKIPNTDGPRNSHASKPNDEIIKIKNSIPPIISDDLWDKVQRRIITNRHAPAAHKAKIDYLLSGKLFCGECGGAMVGQSSGNHQRYGYYECCTKKRLRTCKKSNVKKELVEKAVINFTLEYILTDEVCDRLVNLAHEELLKQEDNEGKIKAIQKQQHRNETETNNMIDAIKRFGYSEALAKALEELEHEKDALNEQLDAAKFYHSNVKTKEAISAWLKKFAIDESGDSECYKNMVDIFINSVFVYEDGTVVITYNWPDSGEHKINISDIKDILSPAP